MEWLLWCVTWAKDNAAFVQAIATILIFIITVYIQQKDKRDEQRRNMDAKEANRKTNEAAAIRRAKAIGLSIATPLIRLHAIAKTAVNKDIGNTYEQQFNILQEKFVIPPELQAITPMTDQLSHATEIVQTVIMQAMNIRALIDNPLPTVDDTVKSLNKFLNIFIESSENALNKIRSFNYTIPVDD